MSRESATPAAAPPEKEGLADLKVDQKSGTIRFVRLRVLLRMPLQLACVLFFVVMVAIALFVAPLVQDTADHQDLSLRFLDPFTTDHGWAYFLGADALGRPELAQILYGTRTSFLVAASVVLISAVVGSSLGMFSGYLGGWVDAAVMRVADVVVAMPTLLIATVVLFVLPATLPNLVLILALSRIPVYMRTARGQTLSLRERVFIEASKSLGAGKGRIVAKDITPLVVPTILTVAMLDVAGVILATTGLSFLGAGLQRPNVDWGILVADGRTYVSTAWWVSAFPGLIIALTCLAANFISNWLRAMDDPVQSGRLTAKLWPRSVREAAK
ncbi:MAG: ABC transporter permease [Propionibacteriaceae bacterium]|jgi:peptide/nickel transport system permease protein|nr:ABC transporter permease [Propionibacteriaceae bacterium]